MLVADTDMFAHEESWHLQWMPLIWLFCFAGPEYTFQRRNMVTIFNNMYKCVARKYVLL